MKNENPKTNLTTAMKKKRNRKSKLSEYFHTVATLLLLNARAKAEGKPCLSLDKIAERIDKKHGVLIHKSTLSRYISKHHMLKLLGA